MSAAAAVLELAAALHVLSNPWKALAMLRAYFDESGIHAGAPITAIAGFVATAEVWAELTREWDEILGRLSDRGVSWFHMTDCIAGAEQFAGVPLAQRQALIAYLAGVISRNDVTAVWAGVNNEHFDNLAPPGSDFRARYPKAYDLCFDEVVRQLWWWSRHHADGTRVPVVFAEQTEYRDRNQFAYEAWRAHPRAGEFLGGLTYDFPKSLVPLQTADMLAYEIAKEWEGAEYGEISFATNFQWRPTLSKITERRALHAGGLYSEAGIKTALARFHANGRL